MTIPPMDTSKGKYAGSDNPIELALVRDLVLSGEARAIRINAHLSLAEIGSEVGASVSAVWRWENGERLPRGQAALRYGMLLRDLEKREAR